MSDTIEVTIGDEVISLTTPEEIISVHLGDENFTIEDTTEVFTVVITEEGPSDSFIINDVSETISAEIIEEVIDAQGVEEVFDFTSSEAVLITTYNDTYNIDTTATTGNAGETINGHRVVTRSLGVIYHADKDNLSHQTQILGMSLNAGLISTNINIITMGYVLEPSWSWTPDKPLFLDNNGSMTETPPTTGFLIQVAQSISATEVWIDIKMGITLG